MQKVRLRFNAQDTYLQLAFKPLRGILIQIASDLIVAMNILLLIMKISMRVLVYSLTYLYIVAAK